MERRPLHSGEPAPAFDVQSLDGRGVALKDYLGHKLLLSFFRYGACPLCNLRMSLLIDAYPRWQAKGLNVVAVFESPAERLLETVARQPIPFPLIPDPDRTLYREYGMPASWLGFLRGALRIRAACDAFRQGFHPGKRDGAIAQLPAEFLIGPDLKIERAYYGVDIGDHLPLSEIDAWLNSEGET